MELDQIRLGERNASVIDGGDVPVQRMVYTRLNSVKHSCVFYANLLCGTPIGVNLRVKAEGVRFELTRPFGLPVFKTGAINRSATPPENW